jgi:hypothetical protein
LKKSTLTPSCSAGNTKWTRSLLTSYLKNLSLVPPARRAANIARSRQADASLAQQPFPATSATTNIANTTTPTRRIHLLLSGVPACPAGHHFFLGSVKARFNATARSTSSRHVPSTLGYGPVQRPRPKQLPENQFVLSCLQEPHRLCRLSS